MTKKFNIIVTVTLPVLVSVLLVFVTGCHRGENYGGKQAENATIQQYVCSMHPQVIRDGPGDCPICGMFLIEMISKDKNSYDSSLTDIVRGVNENVLASAGTVFPERKSIHISIDASGYISFDPGRVVSVSARFGGKIQKSFVKFPFQFIRKGQKIFEVYSPYIYNERWNYVRLIRTYPDREDLTKEAIDWFKLLGLSEGQIDSLKKSTIPDYYLPVYSPAEGYAIPAEYDLQSGSPDGYEASGIAGLTEGRTIAPGELLFKLIDPGSLRIDLKVKSEDVLLLRAGQNVIISDPENPQIHVPASVSLVEPLNGGLFQTARVYIRNNTGVFIPGRKVKAKINAGEHEALWVPVSSVINLGKSKSVFVRSGNLFTATRVTTGIRSDKQIEITNGIDESMEIAQKALFLIDSDGLISMKQK